MVRRRIPLVDLANSDISCSRPFPKVPGSSSPAARTAGGAAALNASLARAYVAQSFIFIIPSHFAPSARPRLPHPIQARGPRLGYARHTCTLGCRLISWLERCENDAISWWARRTRHGPQIFACTVIYTDCYKSSGTSKLQSVFP